MDDLGEAMAAARRDSKRRLRMARTGALATLDGGAPLTTLVGVASDWDGAPLFLMSDLARHTRNLADDPRASLLLTSEAGRGDPLNLPRLTLNGVVRRRAGDDGRERYARRNPKAKLYINFADFSLRRLEIATVHFNGGFGRADALTPQDLLVAGDAAALAAAEAELLERAAALGDAELARRAGAPKRAWRPVGLDAEGLDLGAGGEVARIDFAVPAYDAPAWWAALTG
ncbi:MAG: pyridoxamine 5'-phosphate oxidase family protein [Pseudomonadota bacterium]|nr:pyridoxamine 5'-phosphate oxidase family protein [Pseudomonadota bacterium]